MSQRSIQIGESSALIDLHLLDQGVADTGQSPTVSIRRRSDGFYLDFDDSTFKGAGWTTKNQALTEVVGTPELAGHYQFSWDSSAIITEQGEYAFDYSVTIDSQTYLATDLIHFSESDLSEKILVNRMDIDVPASEQKVYEKDGTSVAKTWPLTDKNGSPVVVDAGAIANRGVPS